jgi:hypothetical protein
MTRTATLRRYHPDAHNGRGMFAPFDERTVFPGTRAADLRVYGPNYGLLAGESVQVVITEGGTEVDWAIVSAIGSRITPAVAREIALDVRAERTADAAA